VTRRQVTLTPVMEGDRHEADPEVSYNDEMFSPSHRRREDGRRRRQGGGKGGRRGGGKGGRRGGGKGRRRGRRR